MTCSMLSAIMASAAPPRYSRQAGLRSAANLAGCAARRPAPCPVSGGSAGSTTATCVGTPQAAHIVSTPAVLGGDGCNPLAAIRYSVTVLCLVSHYCYTYLAVMHVFVERSLGARMFAKVRVTVGQAGDGAVLLRSAEELGGYPVTVRHSLRRWAAAGPDHPLVAERGPDGAWRTVSYGAAVAAADAIGQALLERGLGPARPLLLLSGNSVHHLLMTLRGVCAG